MLQPWLKTQTKALLAGLGLSVAGSALAQSHIDRYVPVVSTAPSMPGATALLYVRERLPDASLLSNAGSGQVVLFVHGAGTPAAVAFDVPYPGYSWMQYLAQHGFTVHAMDLTGYGRSTRPHAMNDRCNLSPDQQQELFGDACAPSYAQAATTMASDWHDIDAVVESLRTRHGVAKVHLVAWSQGGPRAAGYASQHPAKVGNIVLLAPAYNRNLPATASDAAITGTAMTKQSRADFDAGWARQTSCENQFEPAVADAVWQDMLASDPVGATWGEGVRRAPRVPTFGWTTREVAATTLPVLTVVGQLDSQVAPARAREFHADLGSTRKVLLELPCASHNAMWEKDAALLFEATRQWLLDATWEGKSQGEYVLP